MDKLLKDEIVGLKKQSDSYQNLKILESTNITTEPESTAARTLEYVFDGKIGAQRYEFRTNQVYIQHNDILFWIRISDLNERIDLHIGVLQLMVNSLRFNVNE